VVGHNYFGKDHLGSGAVPLAPLPSSHCCCTTAQQTLPLHHCPPATAAALLTGASFLAFRVKIRVKKSAAAALPRKLVTTVLVLWVPLLQLYFNVKRVLRPYCSTPYCSTLVQHLQHCNKRI
jgi:hypothetical protein